MTRLRLGVQDLLPAEAGLVRALLSLATTEAGGTGWSFVAEGPCDVLVVDGAGDAAVREAARQARSARALLAVGDGGPDASETLPRPLRADRFAAALARLHRRLSAAAADLPVAAGDPALRRRYRLRRWPPAQLLRGEAMRVRMASQLSRRVLSACELAQLTQQEPGRSQTFLQLLQGFQLLEPEPLVADRGPPRAPSPAGAGLGLIRSIRRRLRL